MNLNPQPDFPPKSNEQKENIALKEKLNSGLAKLQEIIKGLPAGSPERARAEHTLNSVKGALKNFGKNGAPEGKYAVAVESNTGNPQAPYTQNEGIPVDDLIDILKKAAKVNYEKGEEVSDAGFMGESKQLNDLATELEKNSEGYFDAHYTKEHGEGGAWTKEEQNKQDLRTKHEARLISGDYRATGSEEGDYKLAMDVLKRRRELKFVEQSKAEPEPIADDKPESAAKKVEGRFLAGSFDELIAGLTEPEYISDVSKQKYSKEDLTERIRKFRKTGELMLLPRIGNLRVLCVELFDTDKSDPSKIVERGSETDPTAKKEGEKTPEEKNGRAIFLILLGSVRGGDMASITAFITFIQSSLWNVAWLTEKEKSSYDQIIFLCEKIQGGDTAAINALTVYLNNTTNIWVVNPSQGPQGPAIPPQQPGIPQQPQIAPGDIDGLRDMYIKAKRLRGNAARGLFGRIFGRKLNFKGDNMDFGGKEGIQELKEVRMGYQKKLAEYQAQELGKLQAILDPQLASGAITQVEYDAHIAGKSLALLSEEDANIDRQAIMEGEKNIFEKMKAAWRRNSGKRLLAGIGLFGASLVVGTGGSAAAVGILGARTAMGTVGTYVGVEGALERYGKTLGHKGLTNEIGKNGIKDIDMHIASLPDEDVKKEAARLRMLQVEKGIALGSLYKDKNGKIAQAIIKRDNEMMVAEAMKNAKSQNPALRIADALSNSLARQINSMNITVESEVDKERIKKMARKTLAAVAGVGVGWLIGGSLFHTHTGEGFEGGGGRFGGGGTTEHFDNAHSTGSGLGKAGLGIHETIPHPNVYHVSGNNDNLWNILKDNLQKGGISKGLDAGRETHLVDAMKNVYEHMTPDQLRHLGFSSGNIHILHAGDTLNLTDTLGNPGVIVKNLINAKNVSPADAARIIQNNTIINDWFLAHHNELTGVFDTAKVDAVLRAAGR